MHLSPIVMNASPLNPFQQQRAVDAARRCLAAAGVDEAECIAALQREGAGAGPYKRDPLLLQTWDRADLAAIAAAFPENPDASALYTLMPI